MICERQSPTPVVVTKRDKLRMLQVQSAGTESVIDKTTAPARCAGADFSECARGSKDIVRGVLRLCGCVDQELAIVAKLLKPAGHVCGLILDDRG